MILIHLFGNINDNYFQMKEGNIINYYNMNQKQFDIKWPMELRIVIKNGKRINF